MRRALVLLIEWRLKQVGWVDDRHGVLPNPNRVREWNFYVGLLNWLDDSEGE